MFSPHFWCAMAFVIKIMPFQNLVYMVLTWGTRALHLFNVRHPRPQPQPWQFTCLSLSITSMNPFWQLVFLTPFSFNIPSKHYERHIRPAFLICEALDNLGMECAGTRTRWSSMTNAVTCCGQRFLHQMKVVLQPDLQYWTVYIWLDGGSLDVTQINSKNSSLISALYMLKKISISHGLDTWQCSGQTGCCLYFFHKGKWLKWGTFLPSI